jgi:hypothetical protein
MFVVKQCECGSTDFEKEVDDNVLRCAECFRLAKIVWQEPENKKECIKSKE